MADYDPRLVELYDLDNPDGPDHDFYRSLAVEQRAATILDLGCGTGLLTVTLAGPGRRVVGIDPSPAMLAYARRRPGADRVEWLLGDSRAVPSAAFDYAVMTGNVAQHVPESDWQRTLLDLRAALRPGGVLAFESRNPDARAWLGWTSDSPTTRDTAHGPLTESSKALQVAPGVVDYVCHNVFDSTGERITERQLLHFRDLATLRTQLAAAGFETPSVYGDWVRGPLTQRSPVMVFVATAA